ncbi:MAG: hypothetical protein K6F51_09515 [Acetatifactor sp.]|nr:hypothetical protein [Acetatifactor sp.]
MKDFITSLPGRIVIITALLIILGGVVLFVVIRSKVDHSPKEPSEETMEVVASSESGSNEKKTRDGDMVISKEEETYVEESVEDYLERTAKIVSKVSVIESANVMTGAEVTGFFGDRGFGDASITSDFSMDGNYVDEVEVTSNTAEKYPEYTSVFEAESGITWMLDVANGCITAIPISYLIDNEVNLRIILSESDKLVSYDPESNQFFEVVPDKWEYFVVTVPKVDAETLNKLTSEELDKLWK